MAAITTAVNRQRYDGIIDIVPMDTGAGTIPKGAIVCLDATGAGVNGADGALYVFAGIAEETKTFAGSADGDTKIRVARTGTYKFAVTDTISVANLGTLVYVKDNNTVALTASTTNTVCCGILVQPFISANLAWVNIDQQIGSVGITG